MSMTRRLVFATLLLAAALPALAFGPKDGAERNVAVLLFPGVQIIDYTGPWEVLGHARIDGHKAFRIYSVGETTSPIETAMGMTVIPSFDLARAPRPDVLVIPGGNVDPQLSHEALIRWIQQSAKGAEIVLSVCNGAFFLAQAGLLDGLEATTFAGMIEDLQTAAPKTKVVRDKRFVDNGKIITSAGLSSGIDGALHVIEKLYGKGTAQIAAVGMEYDWRPDSGWARASLADQHLDAGFQVASEYPRTLLRYEGTRERWEASWRIRTDAGPAAFLARLDTAFAASPGWKKKSAGTWRFESGGETWTQTARVEPVAGEKALAVTLTVARAR
jgi:putative intracellular protease/amidase